MSNGFSRTFHGCLQKLIGRPPLGSIRRETRFLVTSLLSHVCHEPVFWRADHGNTSGAQYWRDGSLAFIHPEKPMSMSTLPYVWSTLVYARSHLRPRWIGM